MRVALPAVLMAAVLPLAGCRVGPEPPLVNLKDQLAPAYRQAEAEVPAAADLSTWWEGFDDPDLTRLVRWALVGNLDLAAARERVIAARARRGIANADRLPRLDAEGGFRYLFTADGAISFNGAPPGSEVAIYSAGVVAGWELDLWGRVARLVEAADAEIRFAAEDFRAVRVSLAADVAREVVTVRALDAEIRTVTDGIASDRDVLAIAEARSRAGFSDALDASRARRVLAQDLAELPDLRARRGAALLRIDVLLGEAPGTTSISDAPIRPTRSDRRLVLDAPPPAAGVPADLLLRRPEVRRAAADLVAANARIGAAQAERYPRVTLAGSITLQGTDAGDALDTGARVVSLGPSVSLPIFQGGRIDSNVAQAQALTREAVAAFSQSVVEAQSEVETAALRRNRGLQQVDRLAEATAAAEDTETLARDRYTAGASDFLSVTEAVTSRLSIERQQVVAERETLLRLVDLYAALGGGW